MPAVSTRLSPTRSEEAAVTVILAIDPGPVRSSWVRLDTTDEKVLAFGIGQDNEQLVDVLRCLSCPGELDCMVVEKVQSYGRSVGAPIFETVFWSGRFAEAVYPLPVERIANPTVRTHLCGRAGVGYPELKSALYDRFGGVEGRAKAVGVKKAKGPLYGFTGDDVYAALGLAVTWADLHA